jgi:hypothetical protein
MRMDGDREDENHHSYRVALVSDRPTPPNYSILGELKGMARGWWELGPGNLWFWLVPAMMFAYPLGWVYRNLLS